MAKQLKLTTSQLENIKKYKWLYKLVSSAFEIVVDDSDATEPPDTTNPNDKQSVHATTFLRNGAKITSHVIMSKSLSDDDRSELIAFNKSNGYGVLYVYLANEGDYGRRAVAYSSEDKAFWRKWLKAIIDSGARPIIWMCADDSSGLSKRTDVEWEALIKKFNADCGDLVSEYVTGLECDERWTEGRTRSLTAMIKRETGKPVGVHTTGLSSYGYSKGSDKFYLQCGFGKNPSQVASIVKEAITKSGIPVVCAEYHKSGETSEAKAIGDAAISAGASGVGNGCSNSGLAKLGGLQSLPISGVLKAAKWLDFPKIQVDAPDIEGWPTKTVDDSLCCAQLFVDGQKVEWIKRGNNGKSSVWNALNKNDKKYYRPAFASQKTCDISVADVNGKNESNRITLDKPVQ